MEFQEDRYTVIFEGCTIELVGNNAHKTLRLLIDGKVVAREQRVFQYAVSLTKIFEHNGVEHSIFAIYNTNHPFADIFVEIDDEWITTLRRNKIRLPDHHFEKSSMANEF